MKAKPYIVKISLTLVTIAAATVLMAGCHSSHGGHAAGTTGACSSCGPARTAPAGAGAYPPACPCPSCRDVSALDESTRAAVDRFFGGPAGDTVHICDRYGNPQECSTYCKKMT